MTNASEQIVTENISIPTIPAVVEKISALIRDPHAGTRDIGAVLAQDAPLSSKVLRIANSAFYGLRQRVMSTEHATAVLGTRVLRSIVIQASVVGRFAHLEQHKEFDLERLWRHSVHCAQISRYLACDSSLRVSLEPEELYTCGLLHDLGRIVLLEHSPERYLEAQRRARTGGLELHVAERELLGSDHMEIGALVAMRWNFPAGAVKSIQHHHSAAAELPADGAVAIVNLANRLSDQVGAGVPVELIDLEGRGEALGMSAARTTEVCEFAAGTWDTIEI